MKEPFYVAANNHDSRQLFIHKVWARDEDHAEKIVGDARPYATVIEVMDPEDFEKWIDNLKATTKEQSDRELIDFIKEERQQNALARETSNA